MSDLTKELKWISEIQKRMAPFANLPEPPDFGLDSARMERLWELQKASGAFTNQINSAALAVANELNHLASVHSESFRQVAEQHARLSQIGASAAFAQAIAAASRLAQIDWDAIVKQLEIANRIPQIDWEAVAADIAHGAIALAVRGWFIPLEAPLIYYRDFLGLIEAGRIEECERQLEDYYEENLATIREELLEQFPERREFLERAFKHHEEGDYLSAIPLFLIQSDGIGQRILGTSPFQKKNVKNWVDPRMKSMERRDPSTKIRPKWLPLNGGKKRTFLASRMILPGNGEHRCPERIFPDYSRRSDVWPEGMQM